MRKITRKLKPHIRFHTSGLIEILSEATISIGLAQAPGISFLIDDDGSLFLKKDPRGFHPSAMKGKYYRYSAVSVTKEVFKLVDVKKPYTKTLSFRIGLDGEENGLIPIITRRPLGED